MPYDPNDPRNRYAPKPGSPQYEQWLANRSGKSRSDGYNEPQRAPPPRQYSDFDRFLGEGDPNRTDAYGNRSGAGDGSKFQDDFHKFNRDLESRLLGGRAPEQFQGNPNAGQLQTGLNGTTQASDSASVNGQTALIQQLQDQAAGRGPSLAQMQLQKATDQNMAQAMALGASQRGAGQAGMLKGIQQQQASIGQGMANDSAMLRLQEQMQARGQLGQQLGQQIGQQNQQSQFNAGQVNAQNIARESAMAGAEDRRLKQWELEQKMKADAAQKNSIGGMLGGFMTSISDERLKTEITPGESKLYAFLDKLGTHEYAYKDPKHGEGRRISPMAQELEQTPEGREFVFETEIGKKVDYGKGFGTMLASQAALHRRLKKLEGK